VSTLTREQLRNRRKREVRARSESVRGGDPATRLTKKRLALRHVAYPNGIERPRTRDDCSLIPRPCPFVSCKWNLYLDVSPRTVSIKLNFPDLEPWEMPPDGSCALDVAERGGATLEEVGDLLNVTRERIRQLEARALSIIHRRARQLGDDDCRKFEYHPERQERSCPVEDAGERMVEAVRDGARTTREIAQEVYGNGGASARAKAGRVLCVLAQEGQIVRIKHGYYVPAEAV
jgi:hypothetical protein